MWCLEWGLFDVVGGAWRGRVLCGFCGGVGFCDMGFARGGRVGSVDQ